MIQVLITVNDQGAINLQSQAPPAAVATILAQAQLAATIEVVKQALAAPTIATPDQASVLMDAARRVVDGHSKARGA